MALVTQARSISRRWLAVLALVAALVAQATGTTLGFAGPVSKFTNDGSFAHVYGYSGCLWVYLDVSRGGSKVFDHCSGWELIASGAGTIPNRAFTASNKHAQLSVVTSNSPGLFTTGATGAISLNFTRDGVYQYSSTGHGSVTYLDRTIRWHGSSSSGTADASGTLIDFAVNGLSGEVGEGRERPITVEHAAK